MSTSSVGATESGMSNVAPQHLPPVRFGTDGVRGRANTDLTPEVALALGRALVTVLHDEGEKRPSILVGRDPR